MRPRVCGILKHFCKHRNFLYYIILSHPPGSFIRENITTSSNNTFPCTVKKNKLKNATRDYIFHLYFRENLKSIPIALKVPNQSSSFHSLPSIIPSSREWLGRVTLSPGIYTGLISANPRRRGTKRSSGRQVRSPSPWQLHPVKERKKYVSY